MRITVENKNGEVIQQKELDVLRIGTGTALGVLYGSVAKKAYTFACGGGWLSNLLGTAFGAIVGTCVGYTTYKLTEPTKVDKEEDDDVSIG